MSISQNINITKVYDKVPWAKYSSSKHSTTIIETCSLQYLWRAAYGVTFYFYFSRILYSDLILETTLIREYW